MNCIDLEINDDLINLDQQKIVHFCCMKSNKKY